jgi:hypothetical protein
LINITKARLTRYFLFGAIASLTISAIIGIIALLGFRGDAVGQTLVSTASISFYCILALACAATLDRQLGKLGGYISIGGLLVCLPSCLLTLSTIWFWEWIYDYLIDDDDVIFRIIVMAIVWPSYYAHMSLLFLPGSLRGRIIWVRRTAITASSLLAGTLTIWIWFYLDDGEDLIFRVFGILAIVGAAASVLLPILLRLAKVKKIDEIVSTPIEVEFTCPKCETTQSQVAGKRFCENCGLKIVLEIEEPRCEGCGYHLYMLEAENCPECGRVIPEIDRWPRSGFADAGNTPRPALDCRK